jgi:hypothetical protein
MEFLQQRGEGIHHISFSELEDHDEFLSNLENEGVELEMCGVSMEAVRFTYMSTQNILGTIYEALKPTPPEELEKVKPWGVYERQGPCIIDMSNRNISQIGIVVADVIETMKNYWEMLGWGPWKLYDLKAPLTVCDCLKGVPCMDGMDFRCKMATTNVGDIRIELIEPVHGPSSYMYFMKKHGQGIHHFGFEAAGDHDELVAAFAGEGIDVEMSGRRGDGVQYTYLDTQDCLGAIIGLTKENPDLPDTSTPYATYPASE